MKVGQDQDPDSIACPSCGTMLGQGASESPEVEIAPGAEVIRGDSAAAQDPPQDRRLPDQAIPDPRREEFKVPDMISNVGERQWAPGKVAPEAPKLDASRLASTDDERLAPDIKEEGGVQVHVARKITGWDLDKNDDADTSTGTDIGQLKGKLAVAGIGLVSFLFVGLIVYGVLQSLKEKKEPAFVEEEKAPEEVAREALSYLERESMDNNEELFAAAGAVISEFLSAPTFQDRLTFARDPERVGPLMERYYQTVPEGAIKFREPENGWTMQPFDSFLLATVVTDEYKQLPIAVERQEDGGFLVDWESFVGYSEIPWEEFMVDLPPRPFLVRAQVSVGDYFNYGFEDTEWFCVCLQDRRLEHTAYGYIEQGSQLGKDIFKILDSQRMAHLTLKLSAPGDGKASNQFLITEFVANGWVFPNPDGGEGRRDTVETDPPG